MLLVSLVQVRAVARCLLNPVLALFSFSCYHQRHPAALLLCPDWAWCSRRKKGWEENWLEVRGGFLRPGRQANQQNPDNKTLWAQLSWIKGAFWPTSYSGAQGQCSLLLVSYRRRLRIWANLKVGASEGGGKIGERGDWSFSFTPDR